MGQVDAAGMCRAVCAADNGSGGSSEATYLDGGKVVVFGAAEADATSGWGKLCRERCL